MLWVVRKISEVGVLTDGQVIGDNTWILMLTSDWDEKKKVQAVYAMRMQGKAAAGDYIYISSSTVQ